MEEQQLQALAMGGSATWEWASGVFELAVSPGDLDPDDPETALAAAIEAAEPDVVILAAVLTDLPSLVITALAADRHVLCSGEWRWPPEELQRCVIVAKNRGLRFGLLGPAVISESAAQEFACWIEGGPEPSSSARLHLA